MQRTMYQQGAPELKVHVHLQERKVVVAEC